MKRQPHTQLNTLSIARYTLMAVATLIFMAEGMQAATAGFQHPLWSFSTLNAGGLTTSTNGDITLLNRTDDGQEKPDSSVARIDASVPAKLFMHQNYPNPFRSQTSLQYGLPGESYVRVTIHSALGPVVKVVVDERQPGGVYTLDLTIPDLMPGVYFYRIHTEFGAVTRRMTIAR